MDGFATSPVQSSQRFVLPREEGSCFSPTEGGKAVQLEPLDSIDKRPCTSPAMNGSRGGGGGRLYKDPPMRRPQTTPCFSTSHRGDVRDLTVFSKSALFKTTRDSALFADSVYHALFTLPPSIPDVDAYIENDDLKMKNLKLANWELRLPPHSAEILKTAKESVRSKPRTQKTSLFEVRPEHKGPSPSGSPNPATTRRPRSSTSASARQRVRSSRSNLEKIDSFGGVSSEDIEIFIRYIDSLGNGDGEMDLPELKEAFKRIARHRSIEAYRKHARMQLSKLEKLIESMGKTLEEWFSEIEDKGIVDGRHSGVGEKRISVTVLRDYLPKAERKRSSMFHSSRRSSWSAARSVRTMSGASSHVSTELSKSGGDEEEEDLTFVESDIQAILRCIYPQDFSPKHLYLKDLTDATKGVHEEDGKASMEKRALVVLEKLEGHMAEKNLRVHDLFYLLDTDGSGSISVEELKLGLDFLFRSDPRSEALRKRKTLKQRKEEEAKKKLKSKVRLARARVDKAKFTGAYESLKKIEKLKRVTGMRLYDIFGTSGFDISGDGALDAMEIHGMLQSMRVDVTIEQVKALVNYLDEDGNGTVEANEVENHLHRLKQDELIVAQHKQILQDASVISPGEELQKKISAINAFHKFKRNGTEGSYSLGKTMSMRDRLQRTSVMKKGSIMPGQLEANFKLHPDPESPLSQSRRKSKSKKKPASIYNDMVHHSADLPTMKNGRLILHSSDTLPEAMATNTASSDANLNTSHMSARKQLRPIAGSPLDDRWLESFDNRLTRDKRKMLCH